MFTHGTYVHVYTRTRILYFNVIDINVDCSFALKTKNCLVSSEPSYNYSVNRWEVGGDTVQVSIMHSNEYTLV